MTNPETAHEFVRRINAHDVEGMVALMSGDHVFIDSLTNRLSRPAIKSGWRLYFQMVPDYWIKVEETVADENTVILFGSAGGTYVPNGGKVVDENQWETAAAWRAVVRDGKVVEWRIYADNEPVREKMRAASATGAA
jgi:ketosteroid isomerase-like protein